MIDGVGVIEGVIEIDGVREGVIDGVTVGEGDTEGDKPGRVSVLVNNWLRFIIFTFVTSIILLLEL